MAAVLDLNVFDQGAVVEVPLATDEAVKVSVLFDLATTALDTHSFACLHHSCKFIKLIESEA